MNKAPTPSLMTRRLQALMAVYCAASLAHFIHNAEFIAVYPNLPGWLAREGVYLAWLAVTSVGAAGLIAARLGFEALGLLFVGAYGALGLDGLAHYTLALCSEHTFATQATIWFEAASGLVLMLASALLLGRTLAGRRGRPPAVAA
ncbi:hypothetical protein [Variovorax terrae]|uniref:Uncharacterized protein n=1 Tax=Variovorax terrae TaxID=2923278 RepID=A0A9X2APC7_9BURK|nr:hypothetical protein [Variovorax terrae]MCJ0761901.1 hypothetical protein [Variovorax terrae]